MSGESRIIASLRESTKTLSTYIDLKGNKVSGSIFRGWYDSRDVVPMLTNELSNMLGLELSACQPKYEKSGVRFYFYKTDIGGWLELYIEAKDKSIDLFNSKDELIECTFSVSDVEPVLKSTNVRYERDTSWGFDELASTIVKWVNQDRRRSAGYVQTDYYGLDRMKLPTKLL